MDTVQLDLPSPGAALADTPCAHCGLPAGVHPADAGPQFCCTGCAVVYDALHEAGLGDTYYKVQQIDDRRQPAALVEDDLALAELDTASFLAEHTSPAPDGCLETELVLDGVHCAACVWLVERLPFEVDGVHSARLDLPRSRLSLRWQPTATPLSAVGAWLAGFGYALRPVRADARRRRSDAERGLLIRMGICWALAGNVMLIAFALYSGLADSHPSLAHAARYASLALGLASLVAGGSVFIKRAWASIRHSLRVPGGFSDRMRRLHMDVPVALGLLAGFGHSAWATVTGQGEVWFDSLSVLTAALLTARWVQLRSQRLAGDATDRLLALLPTMVRRVLDDGTLETARADELEPGDLVEIPAGDVVPVDGVVDTGRSALDNAVLTGESRPIAVHPGDTVEAGGTNLRAPLRVRVQAAGESTRIGALLRWVREAQDQHAPVTLLADRFGGWFVAAVLGLSVISLGVSLAVAPDETVSRLVALLVITCPCALSMATPLAMAVHSGRAARRGLFIKSSAAIQALTNVDTIVLDKTGTVTEGRMSLAVTHGDLDALRLAALLEAHSDHPVAVAFVQQFSISPGDHTTENTAATRSDTIVHEAVAGAGLRGWIDDQLVVVGRPDWVAEHASMPAEWACHIGDITAEALTPVAIAVDGTVRAVAGVGDRIRSGSTEIIRSLRDGGFSVHLLSGDHPSVVDAVARQLGIRADHAVGRATPEDKRVYIERLRAAGQRVCVAGDGVNDAGALQAADVGLAVHGGRTASLVAADAFLTVPGLNPLADALRSAAGTMRLVRHLLVFSAGYNVLGAAAAVAGLVTPLVAAVAMPISSLVVVAGAVYQAGRLPRTQQRMKPDRLQPDSSAQPPTNPLIQPT